MKELSAQCADVKILSKIQQSFVNATATAGKKQKRGLLISQLLRTI
jgi:hypothetical protein